MTDASEWAVRVAALRRRGSDLDCRIQTVRLLLTECGNTPPRWSRDEAREFLTASRAKLHHSFPLRTLQPQVESPPAPANPDVGEAREPIEDEPLLPERVAEEPQQLPAHAPASLPPPAVAPHIAFLQRQLRDIGGPPVDPHDSLTYLAQFKRETAAIVATPPVEEVPAPPPPPALDSQPRIAEAAPSAPPPPEPLQEPLQEPLPEPPQAPPESSGNAIDWDAEARRALERGEWKAQIDAQRGRKYYVNRIDKTSCWNLVKELEKRHAAAAADAKVSKADAKVTAAAIDWEDEALKALERGEWRAKVNPKDNRKFYVNVRDKTSCWNLVKELERRHAAAATPNST